MKRIIVACGTGIATSETVAGRLRSILNEKGLYNVKVDAIDIKSLDTEAKTADIFVSTSPGASSMSIPTFNGINILTGMGLDEEIEKIMKALGE